MTSRKLLLALSFASVSTAAMGDYMAMLKPPASALLPGGGVYAFGSPVFVSPAPSISDPGFRLKLGYHATRHLAVEGDFVDFGRPAASNPFASPADLASAFRSTGFGVSTVATLPIWNRFSLYGRFGLYRGESRPIFAPYATSLMADGNRGTRMRYGLGVSYDFTKAFGLRADLERFSSLGHPLPTESDGDQVSVGVQWRF